VETAHIRHHVDTTVGVEIAGLVIMARDHVLFVNHRFELYHGEIAAPRKGSVLVEHVGDAAGHAGGKITTGDTQNHHNAAGHIFAAVIARALDDRDGSRVANREPLARNATEIAFPFDRAVEHGIAD